MCCILTVTGVGVCVRKMEWVGVCVLFYQEETSREDEVIMGVTVQATCHTVIG